MLFMGLLEVFIRSQCDLEDPCNRPKPKLTQQIEQAYDFIIIGGGSGGSVVVSIFFFCVCINVLFAFLIQQSFSFLSFVSHISLHRHRDYLKYPIGKFFLLKRVS